MEEKKMDFGKVLAILSQPREKPAPLQNVTQEKIEVPYLKNDGVRDVRKVRLYLPDNAARPMPLIYVPHYEMTDDAIELRAYLAEGWAVASPTEAPQNANGGLAGDDLVFNNAALNAVRHLDFVDPDRVVLVGGSAGGYMTLMLDALQLGLCGSIANGPITNLYFNFYKYWPYANGFNLAKIMELKAKAEAAPEQKPDPLAIMQALKDLPIPFIAALSGGFQPNMASFPDAENISRWEAFSPVALAECFSNPIMVNHNSSDILVPIDQITKRFTYEKPGASLPETFNSRLPEDYPGKLHCSLEERLPMERTEVTRLVIEDPNADGVLPFDADKDFTINIYDNGPVEGYGSHSAAIGTGRWDDIPYLRMLMEKGAAKTNFLTPEKLALLLDRYNGKSMQLPAHAGEGYGSLSSLQDEVKEQLLRWADAHGAATLEALAKNMDADRQAALARILA
ncbi:MAG: prolyl oligopeptidase family serine peptidase [Clostridia bacterium]|nr:prolyl oligopeptidase family serine peptidase [Clostridia bacterium]